MAVQYILSTDRLQSGFRAKYNASVAEIITAFADAGDGTVIATQFDSTTLIIDFTTSFYTKTQVNALLSGIITGILITDTADASGEYDASADGLPEFPQVTIYDANEIQVPAQYDNANKKIFGLTALADFTAKFSAF